MTTLKDVMKDSLLRIGELHNGTATGGSATTLVDSGLKGRDEDWQYGTLFIDSAGSAAPEGEFAEVTAYTRSSGTLTVAASALTVAPAATDEYSVSSPRFPMDVVKQQVNFALRQLGEIPLEDETLSTVASQTEYTLPSGVSDRNLAQVLVSQLSTSGDRRKRQLLDWYARPDGILVFRSQPDSGMEITLMYMGAHPALTAYGSTLSEFVHTELASSATAYWLLKQKKRRTAGVSAEQVDELNDAAVDFMNAKKMYPIPRLAKPWKPILTRKGERPNKHGPWLVS